MSDIARMFVVIGAKTEDFMSKTNQVKQRTNEMGGNMENAAMKMDINWQKVANAVGIAGVAIEAFNRKQAPLTEQTQKLAASLDMTETEMRKLVTSTSNVTFGIDEVLDVMEKGRQQGIRSAEGLQEYASFWDMVGDATGQSAVTIAEAGIALRAVGIAAGEESQALAAFGYVAQETGSTVDEFLTFIERTGPELREMSMDVNDAAAVLGILEHEFGMAGRVARTEFRKAVSEAGGDVNELRRILGITTEQFEEYTQKVSDSSDVIERNAEIHAGNYTSIQKLSHWVSELAYRYGGLFTALDSLVPIMMIMPGLTSAWAAAKAKLNTQMVINNALLLKYIGLLGIAKAKTLLMGGATAKAALAFLGPAGLIAALMAASKWAHEFAHAQMEAWDISEKWKNVIKEIYDILGSPMKGWLGLKIWDALKGGVDDANDSLDEHVEKIDEVNNKSHSLYKGVELWEAIEAATAKASEAIMEKYGPQIDWMREKWQGFTEWYVGTWKSIGDFFVNIWDGIAESFKGYVNFIIGGINRIIQGLNRVNVTVPEWVPQVGGKSWGFSISEIPTMHTGGVYRAPRAGGEGLALLKDRETVLPPGAQAQKVVTINNHFSFDAIHVREEADVDKIAQSLYELQRRRGRGVA